MLSSKIPFTLKTTEGDSTVLDIEQALRAGLTIDTGGTTTSITPYVAGKDEVFTQFQHTDFPLTVSNGNSYPLPDSLLAFHKLKLVGNVADDTAALHLKQDNE